MTDEEKKVIEYWEEKLKEYKKEIEQRQNDEFKGYGTAEDIAKLKYCNLHTLLNLIQTQQKEIEKYKMMLAENCARTVNSDLKQKHKHEEDLEALNLGWKAELEKKDKIIDEMANYIDLEKMDFECSSMCIHEGCIEECIKEYFINKVEKENKDDN